jgi:nitronate monooxygenase
MHEGTMEVGAWSCGMVAGLVSDIPTVKDLIDSIMNEADSIINKRLSNF